MKTPSYLFLTLVAFVAPAFAGVTVNSPSNHEVVSSPFILSADASACSSQPVRSIGYSLDNSSDTTIVRKTAVNLQVSSTAGTHTLHVKTWGNKGSVCVTDVAITVTDGVVTDSSVVPLNAIGVSGIHALSNWQGEHDGGTSGTSSGTMSIVGSPTYSGPAREFVTNYTNTGGERYWVSFGDDTSSTNFFYDAWVYIASPSSNISNLEMDLYQTMPNRQTVLFGFQCDGYSGTWDYSENLGTAASPRGHWAHSNAACNVRNWTTDTWHHVQIEYSHTSTGSVTYQAVWLDGVESTINATVFAARELGWGQTLLTNFQIDGLGVSGSSAVYLDDLTVYRW